MYWYLQKYYVNFSSLNISYQTGARRLLGYQTTVWRKKKRGLKYVYRTLSPDATLAILGTLRSDNAMAVKTSFKKWIYVLPVFSAIIPTHLLNQSRPPWSWIPRFPIQVQKDKQNFVVRAVPFSYDNTFYRSNKFAYSKYWSPRKRAAALINSNVSYMNFQHFWTSPVKKQ